MCTYCMVADHFFRFNPPWPVGPYPDYPQHPLIPAGPLQPPWPLDRLKEFQDLLQRVKELEDKLGCPCEPNKADYLGLLRERIDQLEKKVEGSAP